jgi:hypothetical protein
LRGRGGGESFDGFDAGDTGRDEVVEVVGRKDGTHCAGRFVSVLWKVKKEYGYRSRYQEESS